jgi:hypothetical protein
VKLPAADRVSEEEMPFSPDGRLLAAVAALALLEAAGRGAYPLNGNSVLTKLMTQPFRNNDRLRGSPCKFGAKGQQAGIPRNPPAPADVNPADSSGARQNLPHPQQIPARS